MSIVYTEHGLLEGIRDVLKLQLYDVCDASTGRNWDILARPEGGEI